MKVRLTELRIINNSRAYPGQVIEWPYEKLGRGMVMVAQPAVVAPAPAPVAQPVDVPIQPRVKRSKPAPVASDGEVL